jgi:WhiB family transcriptional regulator, redox-sensing transcriptional regulator
VDWRDDAACRSVDPDLFFGESGAEPTGLELAMAKAVCRNCDVRQECLEWATESRQSFGVWGGLSSRELRMLQRGPAAVRS